MTDSAKSGFTIERRVAAPARVVFEAWTDPAVMRRWWHPAPDWHTPVAESDLRVGGAVRVVMHNVDDGRDHGGGGEYTVVDPYERLAFTWSWDDEDLTSLIELSFTEREGSTDVVLTHSGLAGPESAARHEEGWRATLDNLERKALSRVTAEVLPRRGEGTQPFDDRGPVPVADWETVAGELRKGPGPFWLATLGRAGAPHVRPVFAAWTGSAFVVASRHDAAKSRNLLANGRCTITVDIGSLHVVVEGRARRVTDPERLRSASRAMREVFDWPTEVVGDQLDAGYAAPTSGGPPFDVYEIRPEKAFGFPTQDQLEPTRWTFPGGTT